MYNNDVRYFELIISVISVPIHKIDTYYYRVPTIEGGKQRQYWNGSKVHHFAPAVYTSVYTETIHNNIIIYNRPCAFHVYLRAQ